MSTTATTDPPTTVSDPAERWRDRLDRLVPTAFLVALAFVQQPGWTAADTKLDLVVDPGGFLARAMNLWDPLAAGGQLQNQAYGYLFPMGPFFWLGDLFGISPWVVQRLWWALILVLAYHGTLRVLERLGIGTGWSRIIAAFSYALAPRMLMGLGAISSEIWPMAIAPWILLPLLAVAPGGERPAALRSGVAILLLGAVNAVASLATLMLPLWWILTRTSAVRLRLLGWWSLAVVMATAWWIGPLVLLGRYSPPFLDWIEDARVTTAVASVTEALRGTTQWIATIGGGQNAAWPAGWVAVSSRNSILFGLVVVLVGLLGLGLARSPWSAFARGGLLIGLVLVTFGHIGGVAGPWAGVQADLLDGVLAPFRNTHKFEVVVRLPLALGVAHALPASVSWLRRQGAPWPPLVTALVVMALIGQTAAPAFVGFIQRGPFLGVSQAWPDAARWLEAHPDDGRTLVLPGGNAPARFWGEPKDEPLQPFASQPWIVRDGVPLGGAGATRLLNEIEARVAQGRGGPELVSLLDSLAISRILLVGDHRRPSTRSTPPVIVRAALTESGAEPLVAFGELVGGSTDLGTASDWGLDRPVRELELFDVPTVSTIAPSATVAVADTTALGGGPEGIAALPGRPLAVLESDSKSIDAVRPAHASASDTLQRRQASFSSATDLYGPLLSAQEDYQSARAVHDYWPPPLREDDPDLTRWQTVRLDDGDTRANASSSLAEPALGQGRDLASDAWRAFDASGDTGWRSAGYEPQGEWVELSWVQPTPLPETLVVTLDTVEGADVAALSVVTEAGTERTPVSSPALAGASDPAQYPVTVSVPSGPTASLRLVVEAVRDGRPVVRVLDIGAGVLPRVQPWVRAPATARGPDVVTLAATTDDRPACYPLSSGVLACSPDRARVGEEATALRRFVTLAQDRTYVVSGTVVASGSGADALLGRLDEVRATATSRWLPEPGVSPELAVDGDPKTYWAADPEDDKPSLTITWPQPRTLRGVVISADPDIAGRRPTEVEVTVGGRTIVRAVEPDGSVSLPEVEATSLSLAVTGTTQQRALTATGPMTMPVVVGDVAIVGDSWPVAPGPDAPVVVPCGFGPTVQVDGRTFETSVSTTRGQVLARAPSDLVVCGAVDLDAGSQRIQALASGQFAVRSLVLTAEGGGLAGASPSDSPVAALSWGSARRTLVLPEPAAEDTLVVVRENSNPGWQATVAGETLSAVRADGWAQAWVVPAGTTGTLELQFAPQRAFAASIIAGAVLAVALLLLTVTQRPGRPEAVTREVTAPRAGSAAVTVALVALGGVAGAVAAALALTLRALGRGWLTLSVAGTATVGWVLWSLLRPWPNAAATNRDVVSGALALFLVALATTWRRPIRHRLAPGGAPPGPRLDRGLEQVPADGSNED